MKTKLYNCIKNFFYNLKRFLFNIKVLYYFFSFYGMRGGVYFLIKEKLKFFINQILNQILIRIAENPTYTMFLFLYLCILFFIYWV